MRGRLATRVSRLPLRVRLVAGFSATMLLVLTAAGAFVYWRVEFALDRQLNTELANAAELLGPAVTANGHLSEQSPPLSEEDAYQVLDTDGRVLSASSGATSRPLIDRAAVTRAREEPVRRDVGAFLPTTRRPLRVYATAVPSAGGPAAVLVVAVRRDHRDEALLELLGQLAAAGIGALVITSLVGDQLARRALRPVERYRSQATDIIGGAAGVRLEVNQDRDDEVTRLGNTLNAMLDALEDALERERRFVNDASHELRTPLTLLRTRVQLARRRTRSVGQHEQVLAEVETDVDHLVRLSETLLELGSGRPASTEVGDLARVAAREVRRRRSLAGEPGAGPQIETCASVPVMLAETQILQVLGNLLDNAASHGAPPVRVRVDSAGGAARLQVTDHGTGMDPTMLASATHRFSRSAQARSGSGFGLGLSLTERVLARADGELRLCYNGAHHSVGHARPPECEHGGAMTVTVLLPLASQ